MGKFFFLSVTVLLLFPIKVAALDLPLKPSFPSCLNPQGEKLISYDSGVHGIIGDTTTYQGSDTVYRVIDGSVSQCFCDNKGKGIQTDWWKVSSLTQEQIDTLKNQGWYFVPDGKVWGLENGYYLAKNSYYNCSGSSDNGIGGGGDILSSATTTSTRGQVLGLATTGNSLQILILLLIGSTSIVLRRWQKS